MLEHCNTDRWHILHCADDDIMHTELPLLCYYSWTILRQGNHHDPTDCSMLLAVRTVKARELSIFNYIYLNVQILPGTATINKELMCLLANVRVRYTHVRCKANVDEPMYMLDMRL